MTKARTLANLDSSGVLTSTSSLDATKLTGALPALNGASLTDLPAGGTNTPSFAITRSGNQTASDNTATRVAFDSVKHDTDSGWVANDNQWVVPTGKAGRYLISTKVTLSSGGINRLQEASVFLRGGSAGTTNLDYTTHQHATNKADAISVSLVGIYTLAAGDKISVEGKVNELGGTARIDGDGTWGFTNLSITKIIE
tara:strand:+ start:53 stop:646 length:594 start_codon:yes stop_codon:yes gene_type:complete